MVVYRCHDFWDIIPKIGVLDSWSKFLGFTDEPVKKTRYYNAHNLPEKSTLGPLVEQIAHKVSTLGQDVVSFVGDPDSEVTRIAVGTGAITKFSDMFLLGADVLVLADDGTWLWESAAWSVDVGVPIMLVNHATAEEPGIRNLAEYVRKNFPVPMHFIPQGCLYKSVVVR